MKQIKKPLFIFIGILALSLFLRIYNIDQAFFNLDQDRDAWEMRKMVEDKKPTLIGPDIRRGRVKFFLGPYHYYFFAPSLIAAKFDPIRRYVGEMRKLFSHNYFSFGTAF